jgi:hypothetical protein
VGVALVALHVGHGLISVCALRGFSTTTNIALSRCLQILLYLFTIWSVEFRCIVRYRQVRDIDSATLVKVVPHTFTGTKEVVLLDRTVLVSLVQQSLSVQSMLLLFFFLPGIFFTALSMCLHAEWTSLCHIFV